MVTAAIIAGYVAAVAILSRWLRRRMARQWDAHIADVFAILAGCPLCGAVDHGADDCARLPNGRQL